MTVFSTAEALRECRAVTGDDARSILRQNGASDRERVLAMERALVAMGLALRQIRAQRDMEATILKSCSDAARSQAELIDAQAEENSELQAENESLSRTNAELLASIERCGHACMMEAAGG